MVHQELSVVETLYLAQKRECHVASFFHWGVQMQPSDQEVAAEGIQESRSPILSPTWTVLPLGTGFGGKSGFNSLPVAWYKLG